MYLTDVVITLGFFLSRLFNFPCVQLTSGNDSFVKFTKEHQCFCFLCFVRYQWNSFGVCDKIHKIRKSPGFHGDRIFRKTDWKISWNTICLPSTKQFTVWGKATNIVTNISPSLSLSLSFKRLFYLLKTNVVTFFLIPLCFIVQNIPWVQFFAWVTF